MNIDQMLQQTGAVDAISRELGVDPATAQAGAAALLPSILSGFQNPVAAEESPPQESAFPALGGLGGLLGTFGSLGGTGLLENATSSSPTDVGKGNEILGQIFGSKDGSRAVAASASGESGVEPSLLKKMLPILAMVAAGYVMKHAGQSGGLGSVLGGAGERRRGGDSAQSPGGDILGQIIGAAGQFLGR
ncbi:MAG TPA: DUF937 domain-containing protein [Alphaproteobacteria bacterium]|nr:DUF937 domain-containing protein [Alphaproteobacteria bacterium]